MIGNIYEIIVFSDFLLPMILKNIFKKVAPVMPLNIPKLHVCMLSLSTTSLEDTCACVISFV